MKPSLQLRKIFEAENGKYSEMTVFLEHSDYQGPEVKKKVKAFRRNAFLHIWKFSSELDGRNQSGNKLEEAVRKSRKTNNIGIFRSF